MIVFYGKNQYLGYHYIDFVGTADTHDKGDVIKDFDISWWAVPGTLNND